MDPYCEYFSVSAMGWVVQEMRGSSGEQDVRDQRRPFSGIGIDWPIMDPYII